MSARAVATLVTMLVVGFGGFGMLSADAANPAGFAAFVNPVSQLPAAGLLMGTSCTSSSQCVVVGLDIGSQPLALAGDPSTWGVGQIQELTIGSTLDAFDFGSGLSSVACTSPTSCVAVGSDGNFQPLVLAGDPATWTGAQAKEITLGSAFGRFGFSSLSSIACTSSTACVAVGTDGNFQPLVLAGDPATWGAAQAQEITLGSSFGSGGSFDAVTCSSASSCVAVGSDRNELPVTLSGDPSTWTAAQAHEIALGFPFGSAGSLTSVACTSSSLCLAVGGDQRGQPLTLVGDPSTWDVAEAHEIALGSAFGTGGSLISVTCPSASSCVAVGIDGHFQPLVLVGDPSTTWSAAQAQEIALGSAFNSGGELVSITCVSASTCLAAGIDANSQPLVLAGDPSTWGAAQAQEIPLTGVRFGVSPVPSTLTCVSAGSCLDLGSTQRGAYLIEGSPVAWDTASAVAMTGLGRYNFLDGSACPSSTYCVAVGFDGISGEPLALVGNPSTWDTASGKAIALGSAFGGGGALFGVACPSTTSCVAVGEDAHGQPFTLVGNPATWSSTDAHEMKLGPGLHSGGALDSVTCTSTTACVAVGYDGYYQQPLVLAGNPSSWTPRQVVLGGNQGYTGALFSVACITATYCVGVGESGRLGANPLVLAGNPAHWNATLAFNLKAPAATSTTVSGFALGAAKGTGYATSISCNNAFYCVVVGGDRRSAPLYKVGNPTQWKHNRWLARPAKSSPSFVTARLTTSSCTATACYVGGFANGGDFVAPVNGG